MFGRAAAVGGGLFAGLSLTSFVADSVKLAAQMQDTAASFRVMTSDAARGEALFREVEATADDMRMSLRDTAEAARDLLAADVSENAVTGALRMLGDLALGDAQKLKTLANAYAKVRDEGTVTSRTLRTLQGAGVFLGDELARVKGTDREGLRQMLEDGEVGFRDLVQAMQAATAEGGKFFGALDARADTFAGKIDILGNAWDDFKWKLGQVIIEEAGLASLFDKLTQAVRAGEGGLDNMRPIIREIADKAKEIGAGLIEGAFQFATILGRAADELNALLDRLRGGPGPGERNPDWFDKSQMLPHGAGVVGRPRDFPDLLHPADRAQLDAINAARAAGAEPTAPARVLGPIEKAIADLKAAFDRIRKDAEGAGGGPQNPFAAMFERVWGRAGEEARRAAVLADAGKAGGARAKPAGPEKDLGIRASGIAIADSREAVEAIIASQLRGMGAPKQEDKVLNKLEQQRKLAEEKKKLEERTVRLIEQLLAKFGGVF